MNHHNSIRFLFSASLAVFMLCLSCGQMVENAVEKAIEKEAEKNGEEVDVDIKSDGQGMKMTFEGEDGEKVDWQMSGDQETVTWNQQSADGESQIVIGQNAKIPDDFPNDIPIHPGIKIMMTHSGTQGAQFSLRGSSNEASQKLIAYYARETAKLGWQPDPEMSEMNTGSLHQRLLRKDDRTLHLTFMETEDQTMVTINTESRE